ERSIGLTIERWTERRRTRPPDQSPAADGTDAARCNLRSLLFGGSPMACNSCEAGFQSNQSVAVSIVKSGSNALLYVNNQGRNIVLIRRILLCYQTAGGTGTLYLRASPDAISWTYPSTYLEPGITALYYSLNGLAAGTIVQ